MVTDSEVSQAMKTIQRYCDQQHEKYSNPCIDCREQFLCGKRVDEWPDLQKEGDSN